jgi:hypothetical protein
LAPSASKFFSDTSAAATAAVNEVKSASNLPVIGIRYVPILRRVLVRPPQRGVFRPQLLDQDGVDIKV